MKKRLVFCFDGSWNRLDAEHPTNVVLTAESVLPTAEEKDGWVSQMIFYDEGVGTEGGVDKVTGGMFGWGLVKNLADAYRFLIFNHTPGDEIYVFGFSRGAFTARSFVGLIFTCGILQRHLAGKANQAIELYKRRAETPGFEEEMFKFRSECSPHLCVSSDDDDWRQSNIPQYQKGQSPQLLVRYVGVWDTVGALGLPRHYFERLSGLHKRHEFHDPSLNPSVEFARHAVAINERKKTFEPTLWDNVKQLNEAKGADPTADDAPYQQRWFAGDHGSVGGGGPRRGLSDQALEWIWDGARNAGLALDRSPSSRIYEIAPNYKDHLDNNGAFDFIDTAMNTFDAEDRLPGPEHLHELSISVSRRWHEFPERLAEGTAYRPATLARVADELETLDPSKLGVGQAAVELEPGTFAVHEVKKNENLTGIAQKYYGSNDYARIVNANRDKIWDPDLIYAGQTLRVPNP